MVAFILLSHEQFKKERDSKTMRIRRRLYPRMLPLALLVGVLLSTSPLLAVSNVKLSGVMPLFGDVKSFQISPDGRYAVYLADQDTDEVSDLYSVLLGGGSPVRLNPILPVGRIVFGFRISPDSSRVVYDAFHATASDLNSIELYSVPIGGPAAAEIKLNGTLVAGGLVVILSDQPGQQPSGI